MILNFSVDSLDEGRRVPDLPPPDDDEGGPLSHHNATSLTPCSSPHLPNASALSPWEKWVVRKAQEELSKREATRKRMAEERRKQKQETTEAIERKRKTEQSYRQWLTTISARKREKSALEHKIMAQRESEEQKRCQVLEARSKERFSDWCRRKKEEKEERKRNQQEQESQKVKTKAEQKQRSQKAYEAWLDEVYHGRSKTAKEPSFFNVKPWVGPLQTEDGENL